MNIQFSSADYLAHTHTQFCCIAWIHLYECRNQFGTAINYYSSHFFTDTFIYLKFLFNFCEFLFCFSCIFFCSIKLNFILHCKNFIRNHILYGKIFLYKSNSIHKRFSFETKKKNRQKNVERGQKSEQRQQ